ncbi:MAG: hypothetical protein Q9159_000597 [Coniocarpon cinnabarinum]
MDPISAFGLAANALEIGGALTRVIGSVRELRSRYKRANLTLVLLEHQLSTLKEALDQMGQWAEPTCSAQLRQKSEHAVQAIQTIVILLDERMQAIPTDNDGSLKLSGKLTFLRCHAELRELQDQLNSQIMSLTILVYAYTCGSIPEQQAVMNDEINRQVLQDAEDDASSLIVNNDALTNRSSTSTRDTGGWSREFAFDRDVTSAKVYRTALRSNMRQARRLHTSSGQAQTKNATPSLAGDSTANHDLHEALMHNDILDELSAIQLEVVDEATRAPKSAVQGTGSASGSSGDMSLFPEEKKLAAVKYSAFSGYLEQDTMIQGILRTVNMEDQPGSKSPFYHISHLNQAGRGPLNGFKVERRSLKRVVYNVETHVLAHETHMDSLNANCNGLLGSQGLLLLGNRGAGKSTILRSIGFHLAPKTFVTTGQRLKLRSAMKACALAVVKRLDEDRDILRPGPDREAFLAWKKDLDPPEPAAGGIIHVDHDKMVWSWKDTELMRQVLRHYISAFHQAHGKRVWDMDYLIERFHEIVYWSDRATNHDVLKADIPTKGISHTDFDVNNGQLTWSVFDTGPKPSKLKEWSDVCNNVQTVIFVAKVTALEWGTPGNSDEGTLQQAMNEWESVINSDLFERAGFILVFTHCDILAEEVRKMPIRRRYLARRDANDLPSFFAGKFLSVPRKFSHQLIRVVITGLTEDSAEIVFLGFYFWRAKPVLNTHESGNEFTGTTRYPTSWQTIAQEKQRQQRESIPSEWIFDASTLARAKAQCNILDVPGKCGILEPHELDITEKHDATALVEAMSTGKLRCVDVMRAFCRRAAIAHQLTNCLTEILFDQALSQAAEHNTYMQRHGKPKGPLHGLPISMKDTFRLPGVDRTFGIAALAGRPSSSASTIIDILFCAGAIPFCKTNCSMALIGPDYNNNIFGRTLNPYNKKLCTGGSTGGEAVLVSMKGSPLGVGADLEDEMIFEVLNPLFDNDNLKNWLPAIEATGEPLTPWIQAHGKIKADLTLEELRRLHQRRERMMSGMSDALWRLGEDDEIDAIICPVAPHPTPPLDTWVTKGYTSLWSGMGLPSGVIPVRLFEEGDATVESDVENNGDSPLALRIRPPLPG